MHINLESDYAVRIVDCLTKTDADRLDAQTIAALTGVSPRFTLKIMGKLVAAGIAQSYKGKNGGYALCRTPAEITLRAVIEAVEGPYRFSRCLGGEYDCSHLDASCCPFHSVYDEITQLVVEKLDAITFDRFR